MTAADDAAAAPARADGRAGSQLRPLVCTRGLLNRADGSARWAQGLTNVIAAVYGPHAVGGWRELPDRAYLEVILKPRSGQAGSKEREQEVVIKSSLEATVRSMLLPRTGITIILQMLACAINAACAALVDAGVPLHKPICGVTCSLQKDGSVWLDPTRREEEEAQASVALAFPSKPLAAASQKKATPGEEVAMEGVVTSVTRGLMTVDEYLTCVEYGRRSSRAVADFFRTSLQRYLAAVDLE